MTDEDSRLSLSRRTVLSMLGGAGGTGIASADLSTNDGDLFGGSAALSQAYNVAGDLWIGPDSARSDVDADSGRLYYATDTNVQYHGDAGSWVLQDVGSSSQPVPRIYADETYPARVHNVEQITEQADLPSPTSGTHSLEDNTAYHFVGFVDSPYGLELGSSTPLVGTHGALSGFIHTGGATAITGTNAGYFARDLYLHAPGGTMYDLTGDQSTEMLVESVSHSDAAGLGSIASLGTIEGYRVPTFKDTNFEDFDAGLTLTGTPNKIFFDSCPFRSVSASNVTILDFDENLSCSIVDMSENYVKSVQSDTQVVYVDPAATISRIFQYRGTTHDSTVARSNILNGAAGFEVLGYRVSDSFPLVNSGVIAQYSLDSTTTVTISSTATSKTDGAAYVSVGGSTSSFALERFSHTSPNQATYNGNRTRLLDLTASLAVGNGDLIAAAFFLNGSLLSGTATRIQTDATAGGVDKSLTVPGVAGSINNGDTLDVRLANLTSTTDIEVGEMNVKMTN